MKPAPFETDLGTLAVFDPKALLHRMRQPKTWWRESQNVLDVPEVLEGKVALFPIGREGRFASRLEVGGTLSDTEKRLLKGTVGKLGLQVVGEDVFCGAAERLPGDGVGDRIMAIPDTGAYYKVAPGDYDAVVHVLDWRTDREFFDEDGEPLPTAPADFVVFLTRRETPFDAPMELPALDDLITRAEASKEALRVPRVVRRAVSTSPRGPRSSHVPLPEPEPEPEAPPAFGPLEPALVRRAYKDVLESKELRDPGTHWGTLVLKPRDPSLQTKDVTAEDLLTKVTRVRNEMRVLEQKVNAHEKLEEDEKLNLDAQVTAVYAAMARVAEFLADP
ncbi:MAG TPA: DUF6386 family protein [Planctomycetota bacterium]|nr:DUF6386 family protein [Planctomycetota bacterium]